MVKSICRSVMMGPPLPLAMRNSGRISAIIAIHYCSISKHLKLGIFSASRKQKKVLSSTPLLLFGLEEKKEKRELKKGKRQATVPRNRIEGLFPD